MPRQLCHFCSCLHSSHPSFGSLYLHKAQSNASESSQCVPFPSFSHKPCYRCNNSQVYFTRLNSVNLIS